MQSSRVALFQFLFVDKETLPFVLAVNHWKTEVKNNQLNYSDNFSQNSTNSLPKTLFEHNFRFDFKNLEKFSPIVASLFLTNHSKFKKMLSKTIFSIVFGTTTKEMKGITFNSSQIRITIAPFNLPFDQFEQKNEINEDNDVSIRRVSAFNSRGGGGFIVGRHFFVGKSRIGGVEEKRSIIIRYLFRCPECGYLFYSKLNDIFRKKKTENEQKTSKKIGMKCENCGKTLKLTKLWKNEEKTGRITTNIQKILILPQNDTNFDKKSSHKYNTFFFPPTEITVKEGRTLIYSKKSEKMICFSNEKRNEQKEKVTDFLALGKVVNVIGTTIQNNAKVISDSIFSHENIHYSHMNSFQSFYEWLKTVFPFNFGPLTKFGFVSIVTAALVDVQTVSSSLLLVVKSEEEMILFSELLNKTIFGEKESEIFFPNKILFNSTTSSTTSSLSTLSSSSTSTSSSSFFSSSNKKIITLAGLLSMKTAIIVHLEQINQKNKVKLKRTLKEKMVEGNPINSTTIIGVYIDNGSETKGNSLLKEFEDFSIVLRIPEIPKKTMLKYHLNKKKFFSKEIYQHSREIVELIERVESGDGRTKAIDDSGENLIDSYIEFIENNRKTSIGSAADIILSVSKAIAEVRGGSLVTELDVLMSIYMFEERLSALTGEETELSQFPGSGVFFLPGISEIPTNDEGVLFESWRRAVERTIGM